MGIRRSHERPLASYRSSIVLLAIWLRGLVGVYRVAALVHVLLVALMLSFLAMLKARDAALRPPNPSTED